MKTRLCALPALLCALPALLLVSASALPRIYIEVNGTFSQKPDVSTVQTAITFIRWKKGSNLVVDWIEPDNPEYFGIYKDRTHLNIETLQLEIHHLTVADSGTFYVETEKGTVGTYLVQVIRRPPMPRLRFKPLVCHQDDCVVVCDVETLNLGPITFYWRRNDGEWRHDGDQVTLSRPEEPETITCRLNTPLGDSKSSLPKDNPLYEPPTPPTPPPPTPTPPWIAVLIVFLLIAAVGVALYLLVKYRPDHPVSKKLTSCLSSCNKNLVRTKDEAETKVDMSPSNGALPEESAQPGVSPEGSAQPGVSPEESAQPGVSPEESAQPGVSPEESAQPGVSPEESAPPGVSPEESALPGVSPEGSSLPGVSPEETPLLPSPAGAADGT